MARYGVARQTVQNAIDLLRVEGLVVGRSGVGWFVREPPVVQRLARNRLSRDERSAGRGAFVTDATDGGWTQGAQVVVRRESADERTAAELHIAVGDEILVRERVMSADGQPVQLATSRLPRTLTAGTASNARTPGLVASTPGSKRLAISSITSSNASPAESPTTSSPAFSTSLPAAPSSLSGAPPTTPTARPWRPTTWCSLQTVTN